MKTKKMNVPALLAVAFGLFAFTAIQTASIKGTVIPADATGQVWAISGVDTARAAFTSGTISIMNMKPGTYKLIIAGDEPYKQAVKENVVVQDGSVTDIGEVILEKKQ